MIRWRSGTVTALRREWSGAAELMVTVNGDSIRALAYPALVGSPRVGDRVLLNVTALEAGLGTGGYALVVAIPDRLPADPDITGHIVKSRYTPLQVETASADEQGSAYHELLESADSLDGMPVVVADLHSALPAILAGLCSATGTSAADPPRVAYVMTDGGALPAWFSRTIAGLRAAGWLAATVTTGQSFGGDLEAVTVHSGLLTARHAAGADVAVVDPGAGQPGHRHQVGLLRRGGRRGRQRRRGAGRPPGRVAAGVVRRPARAPPGRLPPQPDRLRPGRPGPRRRGHPGTARAPGGAGRRRRRAAGRAAPAGHRAASTAWTRPCARPRSPCRPWAARWIEDPEYFLAAAAAGRHAAALLAR